LPIGTPTMKRRVRLRHAQVGGVEDLGLEVVAGPGDLPQQPLVGRAH
jgi:hypothetical protein